MLEEIKLAAPEVQQRIMARQQTVQAFREGLNFSGGDAATVR